MENFIRFEPIYQDRVWGGRVLESALDRKLPREGPIGESWEVVDRPEAQSICRGGQVEGLSIRDALSQHGAAIMGPDWTKDRPFPILIKWLDCRERLSLQVHPPAEIAPAMGGEPKTENWFIAETSGDASLIVGLKKGATRGSFAAALMDNTLENCVHRFPVEVGDSILVESGTIHAIDGGNLILEIQQNSDTTYRVYDWGRVGLDGSPRQLHIAESLASIDWDFFEPAAIKAVREDAVIADSREFRIRRVPLAAGESVSFKAGEQPRLFSVVTGNVTRSGASPETLTKGENVLLPYAGDFTFTASDEALILVTENFA
ncbi:MAG: class I mannose-6-phosphate isomerase [Synoicihabitans sp.]